MRTQEPTTTRFSEIQIGETFTQRGTEECLMKKTKDASHNKAGRAIVIEDTDAPQIVGRELTVSQNRRCFLK